MAKKPMVSFDAVNFIGETSGWLPDEVGAFCRLFAAIRANGNSLSTDDPVRLARVAGVDAQEWPRVWGSIGWHFAASGGTTTIRRPW